MDLGNGNSFELRIAPNGVRVGATLTMADGCICDIDFNNSMTNGPLRGRKYDVTSWEPLSVAQTIGFDSQGHSHRGDILDGQWSGF